MAHLAKVTHTLNIECPDVLGVADCIAQLNLWNVNLNIPAIISIQQHGLTRVKVIFAEHVVEVI